MATITVRFYGSLKTFGQSFTLNVADTAEALRALFAQLPNLRQTVQQGFYKIRIGKDYLDNRYIEQGLFYQLKDGMTLHFTPIAKGAKRAGVFNIIVGVVLIAASWYAGGAAGWAYLGASGYGMATAAFTIGASMMISGVATMLTKTPSLGGVGNDAEKKSSTGFGNVGNIAAQGQPVPLAYGRIRCGSMIISQGVETVDV